MAVAQLWAAPCGWQGLLVVLQRGGRSWAELWRGEAEEGRGAGGRSLPSETGRWARGRGAAWHCPGSACSLACGPRDRLHRGAPSGRQAAVANICRLHQAWLEPACDGEREVLPFSRAVGRTVQPCKTRRGLGPAMEPRSPSMKPAASRGQEGRRQAQGQPRGAAASGPKFRKR